MKFSRPFASFCWLALLIAIGAASARGDEPVLKIPATQQAEPGNRVLISSKLNDMGWPVFSEAATVRKLIVTQMPADDARTIQHVQLPAGKVPVADALTALGDQAGIHFRPLMDVTQSPWKDVSVQFSAGPKAFWEAQEELLENSGLKVVGYADDGDRSISVLPLGKESRLPTSAGPWGLVTLESVERATDIIPHAGADWSFDDGVTLHGVYRPDPSVKAAVLYPVRNWIEGQWKSMPDSPPYLARSPGGREFSFSVLGSLVVNGEIAKLRTQLPVKLIHRTQTVDLDLIKSQHTAIEIDGLAVQYFDLQRSGDQVSWKYGMVRQNDQTEESFAELVKCYEPWIQKGQVASGDGGQWVPMTFSGGQFTTGKFALMNMSASGLTGDGAVKLRLEFPSVTQMADVEFNFEKVAVP